MLFITFTFLIATLLYNWKCPSDIGKTWIFRLLFRINEDQDGKTKIDIHRVAAQYYWISNQNLIFKSRCHCRCRESLEDHRHWSFSAASDSRHRQWHRDLKIQLRAKSRKSWKTEYFIWKDILTILDLNIDILYFLILAWSL